MAFVFKTKTQTHLSNSATWLNARNQQTWRGKAIWPTPPPLPQINICFTEMGRPFDQTTRKSTYSSGSPKPNKRTIILESRPTYYTAKSNKRMRFYNESTVEGGIHLMDFCLLYLRRVIHAEISISSSSQFYDYKLPKVQQALTLVEHNYLSLGSIIWFDQWVVVVVIVVSFRRSWDKTRMQLIAYIIGLFSVNGWAEQTKNLSHTVWIISR